MHLQLAQHDRDPLTGLPGCDAFLEDVETACETAETSGRSVSIALMDIDEFGEVNTATLLREALDDLLRKHNS